MKGFFSLLFIGVLLASVIYGGIGSAIYTYEVTKFYEREYDFDKHGIALNGRTARGSKINISDIEAITPKSGGGTVQEWCPGITSKRGHLTLSFAGDTGVCCWLTDKNQYLVPYKDKDGYRHYMCGAWPFIDEIKQPLSQTKINI